MSYQSTGSTGDGYKWATETGHKVEEIGGGLTGLNVKKEDYPKKMQGLSLKNIEVSIYNFGSEKAVFREFGEMLFSHFGVTGPVILTASSYVGKKLKGGNNMRLVIDFKPSLDRDKLDQRLLREIEMRIRTNHLEICLRLYFLKKHWMYLWKEPELIRIQKK